MPERIQLSRRKGWRKPAGAIVVSRPSRWGNPFTIHPEGPGRFRVEGEPGTPERLGAPRWHPTKHAAATDAVARYRKWLFHQQRCENLIPELAGHDLCCWCPLTHDPYTPCHADVLLALANNIPLEDVIREVARISAREAMR